MKKGLKIFGIVVVLILVMLIAFPFMFKDKIVEIAKEEINNQLNAKVEFGDFGLSIFKYFPNLNFEINDVSVIGIDKFEGDTLVSLKQFSANVDVMSVMSDKIEVLGIHLIEPHIYAHALRDSSVNWDIAKESADAEVAKEEAPSESSSMTLGLKEFSIQKAKVVYKDELGDMMASLEDLNYFLSGDLSASSVKLDMSLLIGAITVDMEGIEYLSKANVEYKAGIQADLEKMKFDLLDNQLRLNQLILSLSGYAQMNPDDSYAMDLSFNTNKNQFKDLLSLVPLIYTEDFKDVKTSGALSLSGFAKGVYAENKLPAFNLDLNVENASVKYPDLPASITDINIDLNVDNKDGVIDHTVTDLKRFDLNLAGNPFSARYISKTPISDPYIKGVIKGKIDFNKLKDALPLDSMTINGLMDLDVAMEGHLSTIEKEQYDQFDASGKVALSNFVYQSADLNYDVLVESTELEISPKHFKMPKFDAKIGKSDFHANGQIDNFLNYYFKDEVLTGTFNFTSSLIDGSELAGVQKEGETEAVAVDTATAETPMEVVALPKNIDFKLNTKIDKILYDTYEIDNFKGDVRLKEGVAKMQDVQMNMIGGTIKMDGTYDSQNIEEPKFDFDLDMSKISIPEAFKTFVTVQKLAPIAENCKGLVDMKLNISSLLDQNMEPVLSTMNGLGELRSNSVSIGGSDAVVKLAELFKNDKFKQLKAKDIKSHFEIKDGNIHVKPFDIKMNQLKANFGGKQGLDQSIDYKLNLDIPRSELGNANKLMEGLMAKSGGLAKNVNLPENINADIFITGTLLKPHFSLGTKDMAKNLANQIKDEAKAKFNEAKAKAVEEAKKQADKLMQEAEKQSQKLISEAQKQADKIRKVAQQEADKAKAEAKKEIDKLVEQAGDNPIAKAAAKEAGKAVQKEADLKIDKIRNEADKKANQLVEETKKQTDNIKQKAKEEGDRLIAEAEKK